MNWKIEYGKKNQIRNPIVFIGMPGVGSIGKITLDYLLDELKPKKIGEVQGTGLPHSVFVNEKNLIELPTISLYYKKIKNKEYLFITGDVQPIDEQNCYEFCEVLLRELQLMKSELILTIGGIALKSEPIEPKIYITGTTRKAINTIAENTKIEKKIYGVVGPIIGVTGIILGLAKRKKIPAATLLAETLGHPMYIGITGAKEVLKILKTKMQLPIKTKQLDDEIKKIEIEISKRAEEINEIQKASEEETTKYIG